MSAENNDEIDGGDDAINDGNDRNNRDGGTNSKGSDGEDENVSIPDLSWRVAKLRLEEANTRRFLKRKPVKLPYSVSQKWIQRNWAPKTKQEFEDLVANGNLRTPYISKRPEEYYGARGEWISWEHYLLGECLDDDGGGGGSGGGSSSSVGAGAGSKKNSTDPGMLKWQ